MDYLHKTYGNRYSVEINNLFPKSIRQKEIKINNDHYYLDLNTCNASSFIYVFKEFLKNSLVNYHYTI